MVKEKEVLNMSTHCQSLYELFKESAEDATAFLNGASRTFPDFVVEADRLTVLSKFEENGSKMMLKPCLELIFGGFVSITERMLQDHIAGGKYATPDEDLQRESIAIPTTNANPERDFGILDRLMKYGNNHVCTHNNTSKWTDSLTKEKLAEVMKIARESKSKQKDLYLKRKVIIHETHADRLQNKISDKKQELALSLEKEKLTFQIEEIRGLWSTKKQAKKYLANSYTEKERRAALKTQLTFRSKVLRSNMIKVTSFCQQREKLEHQQNYWQT